MSRNGSEAQRNEPIYNLRAVVKETGLKPPTLRAWERRYGFPNPARSEGGHRIYTQRDIDTLRWLMARQDEGLSISHAIDLWRSLLEGGTDPTLTPGPTEDGQPPSPLRFPAGEYHQIEELCEAWIAACLAFDRDAAEGVLTRAFALYPPETVCFEILQRGLAEIGDGWHRGEVSVQQEHFATALTIQRLEMLVASAAPPWRRETIVVATAEGDLHTFGALLLTFLLRRRGWHVIYLGASVPAAELKAIIDSIQPHLVILTAQLLHTAAAIKEAAQLLLARGVQLAFGGPAFDRIAEPQEVVPGFFLGRSLHKAVQLIPTLLERPPAYRSAVSADPLSGVSDQYAKRRASIDAHVWDTFIVNDRPTDQLAAINADFGQAIDAALKLGDIVLLATDVSGIQDLLISYRLPTTWIHEYLAIYRQAATIHLGDSGRMIVDWLSRIIASQGKQHKQDRRET